MEDNTEVCLFSPFYISFLPCRTGLTHIDISKLVSEKGLDAGTDDARGCLLIDEDKVRLESFGFFFLYTWCFISSLGGPLAFGSCSE